MVAATPTHGRSRRGLLARPVVWVGMAAAADPGSRSHAAGMDAGPGRNCADRACDSAGLAVAAAAAFVEPAQQAHSDLPADRPCAGGAVPYAGCDLGVHRGRPILHPPRGYAHAPAT